MKNVGIITYDRPHLKTNQIVDGLKDRYNIVLYRFPYRQFKARTPLFEHRPAQFDTEPLTGYREYDRLNDACDYYLIGGMQLLSSEEIGERKIINCHPGSTATGTGAGCLQVGPLRPAAARGDAAFY